MDRFEIVLNPGNERWNELIHLTNRDEGWMMAKEDYQSWIQGVGENNIKFYCAIDKETSKIAGTVILAIMESIEGSPRLATVGMFYVRPEFRKTGLGSYLFHEMMKGEENNNVGLNGVMAMTAKYSQRHGFSHYSYWKESIYVAKTGDVNTSNLDASNTVTIIDRHSLNWEDYLRFDVRILAGVRRDGYIKNYLNQTGAHNRFAVHPDGRIIGVCNIRECDSNDLVLGPFYAENVQIASALLKATIEAIPNITNFKQLLLVSPDTNSESIQLFNQLAGGKAEHWGNMMSQFTKEAITVPDKMVYSLTDYANNFV
ncbi:hypothetical protein QR680_016227 [Steinernema hermaphroditum]|uniref:N-acetyltransferase domain-containing protein n=1 Tax=Steinernema hermaphroditum TaxID=289476 RepID=A0AA39LM79_9BILA|nr:hypothetical protein QR680_016227 [Steinernema hermaphroditum]